MRMPNNIFKKNSSTLQTPSSYTLTLPSRLFLQVMADFIELVGTVAKLQRWTPDLWIETADKLPRLAT